MKINHCFKFTTLLYVLFLFSGIAKAQNLTWVSGSNAFNQMPVYGIKGIPSINNTPGARLDASTWTDQNGDLWLFGGMAPSGNPPAWFLKNDLWRYNVNTNEWTWMNGGSQVSENGTSIGPCIAYPSNTPGARRHAQKWTDASGYLWLYGGVGLGLSGGGDLRDLWKYEIATNQWMNINGGSGSLIPSVYGTLGVAAPGNTPGSRRGAVTWTDPKGIMWLFGGLGLDINNSYGEMNDVWRYNPTTKLWTWMGGSNTFQQNGKYGTLGIPSATNIPGARTDCAWTFDVNGNLILFGGSGHDISSTFGRLNDLWKFNIITNEWTWIGGSTLANQLGIYGTQGVSSSTNMPGARTSSALWADGEGKLYLFGGYGFSAANGNELNDLWMYNSSNGEWVWLKGSNFNGQTGTYGTLGVPSPSNIPGARGSAANWMDHFGNLWLFGGYIVTPNSLTNYGDLWKISLCTSSTPTISVSSLPTAISGGQATTLTANGATFYSWSGMYSGTVSSIVFHPALSSTFAVTGWDTNGCASTSMLVQTVTPVPTITVTSSASLICAGQSVTLTATGINTFTWSAGGVSSQIIVSPANLTTYTVFGEDNSGCINSAVFTQSVDACLGIGALPNLDFGISLFPNPSSRLLTIQKDQDLRAEVLVYDINGKVVLSSTMESHSCQLDLTQKANGVYFVQIMQDASVFRKKFVLLK